MPRCVGVVGIVGSMIIFIPLPERAVTTGLQIELARAIMVAALGVLAVRSGRTEPAVPDAVEAQAGGTSAAAWSGTYVDASRGGRR